MAGFMGFSAEASTVLPESAYHARAAREARDGDYAFNARAFPWLYDHDAHAVPEIDLTKLTPSQLNQRGATSADGTLESTSSSSSSSSSSSRPPPAAGSVGLELTMHESHAGHLIGSIVWDGGKVLSWLLEGLHSRVRQPKADGSGFADQDPTFAGSSSALSSFTPPAVLEHLAAAADGNAFDLPKDFLVGARVLELGAGTGITGLACVKLGAREVCITDIRELIPLMKENVRRNCPGCLREEYGKPTETSLENSTAIPSLTAPASSAPTNSSLIPATAASQSNSIPTVSSSSSIPVASSSSIPSQSVAAEADVPLSSLYLSCDNCDDLSEELFECRTCAQSLCDTCDYSFHRPQAKKDHVRNTVSMVSGVQKQQFMADAQLAQAEKALPDFPPRCDVYVEELLWGVDSTVDTMAPSLRAPFDVIIMADVVYDAYSTSGAGSEHCDNYRRLFHTLCLLTTADTTVLLTYTPRRAPEKQFFELLSQQFVWSVFPAKALLPFHEEIDERIHIYQLHRSKYAGGNRIKGVVQDVYPYEQIYGSEAFLAAERKRKAEEEQKDRRRKETQPRFVSASSISIVEPIPARAPEKEEDEVAKSAKPTNMNITPTFTRHLEREEERQERLLQEKLAKIPLAKKNSQNAPSKVS